MAPGSAARTRDSRAVGLAMVLGAAACFGTLSVMVKVAYRYGGQPLTILGVRYLMASALLWVWLGLTDRESLAVGKRNLARIAGLSLAGYGAASMCFFFALTRIDASLMAIILYTYPTLVALASVRLFGEPLTRERVTALALTFVGVVLAVWAPGLKIDPVGVLIGLGAPIGYAMFTLMSFRWRLSFAPEAMTAWMLPMSAVPMLMIAGPRAAAANIASWPFGVWVAVLGMALIPTIVAIGLYVRGLGRLGAPAAAVASTLEPVVTLVLAVSILGERLAATQWLGAVLVLGGVAVAEVGSAHAALRSAAAGGGD